MDNFSIVKTKPINVNNGLTNSTHEDYGKEHFIRSKAHIDRCIKDAEDTSRGSSCYYPSFEG